MSRAWYMDSSDVDQREEHHLDPPRFVPLGEVTRRTGVEVVKLDPARFSADGSYDRIRTERGYNYEDTVVPSDAANRDELAKTFYTEHIHTDEEIR